MGKLNDLTGKRFGRLTVVEITDKRAKDGSVIWACKCECGNLTRVSSANLKRGITKSCGCYQREKVKKIGKKNLGKNIKPLIGKKFGRLIVLKSSDKRWTNGAVIYICKCNCGNEIEVPSTFLLKGAVKSCGCYQKDNAREMQKTAKEADRYSNTRIGSIISKKTYSSNTTGIRGVTYSTKRKCYISQIYLRGKNIYLGGYANKEDAIKARKEAEEKYFKPIIEEFNEVKNNESNRSID